VNFFFLFGEIIYGRARRDLDRVKAGSNGGTESKQFPDSNTSCLFVGRNFCATAQKPNVIEALQKNPEPFLMDRDRETCHTSMALWSKYLYF
jgi:hypothetical protein